MDNFIIPKSWLQGIPVPWGPYEGKLAEPCMCGYHTDLEDGPLQLIQWHDGRLMFCHPSCVPDPNDAEI